MTSQLQLYNGALDVLGSAQLLSLAENVEARHILDGIWGRGAVETCLEEGLWNFASRAVRMEADESNVPQFGFNYYHPVPADYVRLVAISDEPDFEYPLLGHQYKREGEKWTTDYQLIYVKYVSKDASWGMNFSLWPESFTRYVEHYLAMKAAPRIVQSNATISRINDDYKRAKFNAKNLDAANQGQLIPTRGTWGRARVTGADYHSRYGDYHR